MEKYVNSATRIISLIVGGVSFGLLTAVLALFRVARPWAWGMMFGALAALVTCGIFAAVIRHEFCKVGAAGNRVEGNILCFACTGVQYANILRRGYVFLTADRIHLYLWDKRPYLETKVERVGLTVYYNADYSRLVLHFEGEEEDITLYGGPLRELMDTMRDHGYRLATGALREDATDVR